MDIVTMEQVTKVYGENETRVWGLHNVDLTVEKWEEWMPQQAVRSLWMARISRK